MRVLLVGRRPDRDRLRPRLVRAGLTIVAEGASPPPTTSADIEAVVVAPPSAGEPAEAESPAEPLTPREHDVLALLAEGRANKAIAAVLGISDQTVKFHVASIIGKLGAVNRTDAVRRAVRQGLVVI